MNEANNSVLDAVRRYGLDPKRSLGQNFLTDPSYLDGIVAAAALTSRDRVLEIGPGLGTLTERLAAQAGAVVAVELDRRLIELLQAHFAGTPHVQIVHGDILAQPAVQLMADAGWARGDYAGDAGQEDFDDEHPDPEHPVTGAYKVVANLPYYITSAVLRHLLAASVRPALAVLMVQEEVARRICAEPGAMSILAVSVQFYAQPQIVAQVPAAAFYPRPKVDSAVLRLAVRPEPAAPDVDPRAFFSVVRAGFSQKRKQLTNSLSAGLRMSKPDVRAALEAAGITPTRRAETVSLAEWGALCRRLPV